MINSSYASCINQHKQIPIGTHIYHVCNILFDLTIMLDFLIIMDIDTFDISHDGHINNFGLLM
jgi:hypothetical protein